MQLSKKDQVDYVKLIKGLQKLRTLQQTNEVEYLLHLMDIEAKHAALIELAHGSFKLFLKSNKLYDPARYAQFVEGLKYAKEPTARKIGHAMVIALSKTQEAKKAPAAVKAAKDYVAHHKVMPDANQSYGLMVSVGVRLPRKVSNEQETIAQLTMELEAVRAELRTERLKNRQLTTEVSEIKKGKKRSRAATHATA